MIIEDLGVLFDTPEDIRLQLNRENIKKVDYVFYTHWHPDHTIGVRVFEHICWNFKTNKPERIIKVYMPEGVYEDLKAHSLSEMFDYFEKTGVIEIKRINEKDKIKIKDVIIQSHKLAEKNTWCYSISYKNKKVLYAPCDIMHFPIKHEFSDFDLFILEFGAPEIKEVANHEGITDFYEILEVIKRLNPKKVIFTHIEENRNMNQNDLKKFLSNFKEFDFEAAYDGMKIEV